MLIVMKPEALEEEVGDIHQRLVDMEARSTLIHGEQWVFALEGDTSNMDLTAIEIKPCVEKVVRITPPYKLVSRAFHESDTVVEIGNCKIGGGHKAVIAGPCSVESVEQMVETALLVKNSGAAMLRGGAYKPRTSPYSFQGLGEEGLKILAEARQVSGLPVVTEVMSEENFDLVEEYADLIQIGARNMQNYSLLKRASRSPMPILLKRGQSATLEEFLMAAEYVVANGKTNVILCERGIRTFDTYSRNTLDISAIPAVKQLSHLPIIVDPSHASGKWSLVEPLAKAAMAAGADGLIIEVHHQPKQALCDGPQSLKPEKFDHLMSSVRRIMQAI